MGEVLFTLAFLGTPLLALPRVVRSGPRARRAAAFALFAAPLVGIAAYCALTSRPLRAAIVYYPLVLVQFGFWAALLGGGGTMLLERTTLVERSSISRVAAATAVGGAVGGGFMLSFSLVAAAMTSTTSTAANVGLTAVGLAAGAVTGGFAGYTMRSPAELGRFGEP